MEFYGRKRRIDWFCYCTLDGSHALCHDRDDEYREMGSVMPEAGGQYTMAKYMLGPLAAFNVGLMLVLEYAMLEAADVLVVGQILESLNPNVKALPFIILSLLVLTYMNYPRCLCNLDPEFCDYGSCICDDIYFIIFNKLL